MREVDLELDFCPKCAPEETQNPFPVQEHRFLTHLQRSCNVQDAEHTMLHRPDSE